MSDLWVGTFATA